MPNSGLLETLVKLASLGTSGICIFTIFWIGWLIKNPSPTSDLERHKTLRFFMIICVIIAIVSASSGILNAYFNAKDLQKLERDKQALSTDLTSKSEEISKLKLEVAKKDDQIKSQQATIKELSDKTVRVANAPRRLEVNGFTMMRGDRPTMATLNGVAVIKFDGQTRATIDWQHTVQGANQGRVFVRDDGKTNGPWLHLILTDADGREITRVQNFIAPVWECGVSNSVVIPQRNNFSISISQSDFNRLARLKLEDSGGGWREEACR